MFVERKFKFKSCTCLYDLYFDNIFVDDEANVKGDHELQKRKNITRAAIKEFNKYCLDMKKQNCFDLKHWE